MHTTHRAEWRAGVGAVIDPQTKRCIDASVYLTKSPNGHMLAEQCLPSLLKPGLDYFFQTYGFARSVCELDGTNFHGLNPIILKPEFKAMAYKTQEIELTYQSIKHDSDLLQLENSVECLIVLQKWFIE